MLSGPFKRWKHLHKFRYDVQLNQTEIVDEVEFQLPYGTMGRIFEGLTNIELKRIFEHRKMATTKALEMSDWGSGILSNYSYIITIVTKSDSLEIFSGQPTFAQFCR